MTSGVGASSVGDGESPERVDSTGVDMDLTVVASVNGDVVTDDVVRLHDTEMIVINNKDGIHVIFILPPEERAVFIVFLLVEKENPRSEWNEGVVIRHYLI